MVQQGEDIKNEVHMHAQKLIDQIQRSERQLLQEVDTVVQHKRELLTSLRQREQAERVQTRLKTCQEMVETSLKEWNKQQILTEKQMLQQHMKTVNDQVELDVFQPTEKGRFKI